jgi:hypothetical protein
MMLDVRRRSAFGLAMLVAGALAGCGANDEMESTDSVTLGATTTETVALIASADTTVRLAAPNQNFGLSTRLDVNRALVRFDQAALSGAIGASDRLLGAELEFTVTASAKRLLPRPVSAFRLTTAWTEMGATWFCPSDAVPGNSRPDCQSPWSMLAPAPNPWASPATATVVLPSRPGVIRFDVTADVQAFLAGTAPNHGWMLRPELPALFAELGARESTTPPRLLVSVKRCNPTLCNDDNVCTVDACDETSSCTNEPIVAGTSCGDELVCDGAGACVGVPRVVVNEAESSGGVPGDWVELYNAGTGTADLSGWRLLDNDDTHTAYVIATGTSLAPGAFLVLEEEQFGFGLGGADNVRLFDAANSLVDTYAWPSHAPTTYGRCPSGTGAFQITTSATKGTANDCRALVSLNEVESSGGVPGDWVELFNAGPGPADVSGWRVLDSDDTHSASVIPAGTSIAPGAFLVLDEAVLGFGLGGADNVRLFDALGALVDTYAWTSHASITYGRCPNGTGDFSNTESATKGAANACVLAPPAAVKLNEVESSGGVPGDWVELYNAGASAADLSGWRFIDNDDTHVAYVIPAGTSIAPGAFLVLDEAQFGFGLGAGETARLYDAFGTLVDSYVWTAHAPTTYGRCPDGTGAFATTTSVTKGTGNDCSVAVKLNEIESSGGVPGDWVELYNAGTNPADVSGWRFLDNDDTHVAYVIPAGTSIAPGAFLVLEEADFGFGLGGAETARLYDAAGTLVESYAWTAHAPTSYGRCPDGSGAFKATTNVSKGATNDCSAAVRVNEVESSGGTPGDWVELYNAGPTAVDVSGWRFLDNDDTHVASVIPAGTSIAPGGFYVLEEAAIGFGLGGADSARLYDAAGTLLETYAWTVHATTTYGRCPDGSGAFTTTVSSSKGEANVCSGGPPPVAAWPGANAVITVDGVSTFGGNLSDLYYEGGSPSALWAVRNGPSTLFRLVFDGALWTPDTLEGWSAGKTLLYPGGGGAPDTEGVTRAELGSSAMYVATERDNNNSSVSRLSILRFDTADSGTSLSATHEWNLNSDLPVVGANLGLEAITWIPDGTLVASSFLDEATGLPYDPASYPNHGTGLFFVGIEATGVIYAYALDHVAGGFTRVATIASGNPGVMGVSFDREVGYLWAHCDDTCGNVAGVLAIDTTPGSPTFGRFTLLEQLARPSTMPSINNEGIAFAPESECTGGFKRYFWTDDSETDGHSLRADSIPCGAFLP